MNWPIIDSQYTVGPGIHVFHWLPDKLQSGMQYLSINIWSTDKFLIFKTLTSLNW